MPANKIDITAEQWDELANFIVEMHGEIHHIKQHRTPIDIMLYEFSKNYSLKAMHDFLTWAKKHREDKRMIFTTIMHDLNGRHQDPRIFDPRTSGYLNINEGE